MTETNTDNTALKWYVFRCGSGKERLHQEEMRAKYGVETFVPMKRERRHDRNGRFMWVTFCALTSYIFVHCTLDEMRMLNQNFSKYSVMNRKVDGLWTPTVVPDRQMTSFIRVSGSQDEKVVYFNPAELQLKKGDRVRVIGGPFVGVEGEFVQVGGKHEKRVVIQLEGLIAVATAAIPAAMVEKIT